MKPCEQNVGLLICVPTLGRPLCMEWALAFKSLNPPINFNVNFALIRNKPVAAARNEAAEEAIMSGAKYVFFLGDDTVPPPHALKQLIFRMEHQKDLGVVGGIYCSKSDPPAPLVFRGNGAGSYWNWKVGEYFEVTGLGMDCTLIRTDVFKEVSKPWFHTEDSDKFIDGVNAAEQWTEDLYFLWKVRQETKWKIYADAMVICEHWDVNSGKVYTLPSNSHPVLAAHIQSNGQKRIIDIGSGPIYQKQLQDEGHLIRVDARDDVNPDYRCDVRCIPFADKTFDIVFSSHVLEHFSRSECDKVLDEWLRLLKADGEFRLVLPDLEWAAHRLCAGVIDNDVLNVLYGAQSYPLDFHMNGFTPARLEAMMAERNLEVIELKTIGYNILLRAKYKSTTPTSNELVVVESSNEPGSNSSG